MSHWAELDENNIVVRVLVGSNEGDEGKEFFESLGSTWVKTSYNGNIRKNFASIGFKYDETLDGFIAPKCHTSATLDETTCRWVCGNAVHPKVVVE
jgi:hypothetical protein